MAPVTVTVPLKVSGVLPPSVTVPSVPPALVRVTALATVVATLAWTVPLTRFRAPVPRPVGLPMLERARFQRGAAGVGVGGVEQRGAAAGDGRGPCR